MRLNLEEPSNVGMDKRGHYLGFSLHVLYNVGILNVLEREDLHGHLGLEDGVAGQLHLAGGPLAQPEGHQLVVSDLHQLQFVLRLGAGNLPGLGGGVIRHCSPQP